MRGDTWWQFEISAGMGAKASTVAQSAGGNGQSSTGANETTMQGFSMLRSLPGGVGMLQHQHQQANQSQNTRVSGDSRQRARSLSSVPDLSSTEQAGLSTSVGVGVAGVGVGPLGLPQLIPDSDDTDEESGRVYAAHSLPSHIWSLNGKTDLSKAPHLHTLHLVYLRASEAICFQVIIARKTFFIAYTFYTVYI